MYVSKHLLYLSISWYGKIENKGRKYIHIEMRTRTGFEYSLKRKTTVRRRRHVQKLKRSKGRKEYQDYKVFVFDLDDTIYLHGLKSENDFHKNVRRNLEKLKNNNKKLYVATHNKDPFWYLRRLNILDLFEKVIYEQKDVSPWINSITEYTSKADMINEILADLDPTCSLDDIVFFDDNDYNIKDVSTIGVRSVLVDKVTGVVFDEILCN